MIEIRPAAAGDAAALAALRWEFRAGKTPATEDRAAFVVRCAEWIRTELIAGRWFAWVAEQDGRIVGHVWLQPIQKIPNPNGERERHGYLSNLYVTPSARGGIGTRLLQTAIGWAAANGIDTVVLWPTERSRPLYGRNGFAVTDRALARKLG